VELPSRTLAHKGCLMGTGRVVNALRCKAAEQAPGAA
jgi:hypothetical protein